MVCIFVRHTGALRLQHALEAEFLACSAGHNPLSLRVPLHHLPFIIISRASTPLVITPMIPSYNRGEYSVLEAYGGRKQFHPGRNRSPNIPPHFGNGLYEADSWDEQGCAQLFQKGWRDILPETAAPKHQCQNDFPSFFLVSHSSLVARIMILHWN